MRINFDKLLENEKFSDAVEEDDIAFFLNFYLLPKD
jgi:hypothetical protein